MAVMTGRYDHTGMCACNLIELESAIGEFPVPKPGLMGASSSSAAVVVRLRLPCVYEIIFPCTGIDSEAEVFGSTVTQSFADEVTGVMAGS